MYTRKPNRIHSSAHKSPVLMTGAHDRQHSANVMAAHKLQSMQQGLIGSNTTYGEPPRRVQPPQPTAVKGATAMGHMDDNKIFVSDLSPDQLAELKRHALWFARTYFKTTVIESFDLGNLINGYMTAEITTSYQRGQRRIIYYLNKRQVYEQRVEAGQGLRKVAEEYFATVLTRQREDSERLRRIAPQGVR